MLAASAPPTVPIMTLPGTTDRANQDSTAAQTTPAAAVATGLPKSVITVAATSRPRDRWLTNQDVAAVSSRVAQPWLWIPSVSAVSAVSNPATRKPRATYRW